MSSTGDFYRQITDLQEANNREVERRRNAEAAVACIRHEITGSRWTHLKTGGTYTVVGACRIEATNEPAYLYQHDASGTVWARPMDEFLDGRFVRIDGGGHV